MPIVFGDIDRLGSRGGHTYTEAHRRSYEKRQERELIRAREYYNNNAEVIRAKRMTRYHNQKNLNRAIRDAETARDEAADRAARGPPPVAVVSHSGDDKHDE